MTKDRDLEPLSCHLGRSSVMKHTSFCPKTSFKRDTSLPGDMGWGIFAFANHHTYTAKECILGFGPTTEDPVDLVHPKLPFRLF